jgi:two-component system, OmpR family, alkaline phosphatase synthesis response regulator PhoP
VIGAVAPITGGNRPKLLIVNDSKSIVILLKHQMQQAGFEVVTLLDSLEATATIVKERPAVVILGFEMAKLSGPELCTIIKTKPSMAEFAHLPVLLYSSMDENELNARVQECQANGYIHKTWTTETIKGKLSQYLNKS